MIVDVQCDDNTIQIAKIVQDEGDVVKVKYLDKVKSGVFDFTREIEAIERTSISGFYDVENLEDTDLYLKVEGGYELVDDSEDEDFEVSESDEEDSEDDVSLVDEEHLS
jgi:hypothetical protein